MNFIDSHAHLYLEDFDDDLATVIENAQAAGVSQVLLPNIDSSTISRLKTTCQKYPHFFKPMMGLHPTSVDANYPLELAKIQKELNDSAENYIAIGEVGLDLYWDRTYKQEQIEVLEKQLNWSIERDLPVVIHCRDAYSELESILSRDEFAKAYGVIHSFTGNESDLELLLPLKQWMIGINGVVTFKNASLSRFIKKIPLDRLLIETDSPYLTPEPFRGRRNESKYLLYTLKKVAEIYQLPIIDVANQTESNTLSLFKL